MNQSAQSKSSSKKPPLKLLLIEDNQDDALLIINDLKRGNYDLIYRRVDNEPDMRKAIAEETWDIMICDYHMPQFSPFAALKVFKELRLDNPFICMSGSVGEETAVEVMKAGAHDYIMKDRLTRFLPAVERELQQALKRRKLRETEELTRQAQKMEAIGRLAGGVAHDFNNVLASVIIYCDMVLETKPTEEAIMKYVSQIKKSSELAAGLTGQLLAFSRKQVLETKVIDLNPVILKLNDMLQKLIGEHITLVHDLCPSKVQIRMDPTQLEQVIMNLVVNSRDAMPNGGKVKVKTYFQQISKKSVSKEEVDPGPYIVLEVIDEGVGIEPGTIKQVFEPFFTTKGPKKGTGLGLSTVYGIVKQSQGYIEVESEVGKGATFRIFFPEAIDNTDEQMVSRSQVVKKHDSVRTVLLIEDQAELRNPLAEFLAAKGFKVLAPSDVNEAVKIMGDKSISIDLMLSDVVMPSLSGPQLIEKLRVNHPYTRVLLMSGYLDDSLGNVDLQKNSHFLRKPFSMSQLLGKIEEIFK